VNRRTATVASAVAAGAAGLAHALSFAPWNLPWLQVLALAALFALTERTRRPAAAGWLAFAFGMGWFGLGVHWVYISMHTYGQMWAPLAALSTAALAAILSVFPMLALWLGCRAPSTTAVRLVLLLPAVWALAEWLRGWVLTGFPWLATGYAHTDGPLAGFGPVVGALGIHWIAAVLAGGLALFAAPSRTPRYALAGAGALLLAVLAAGQALRAIEWTQPAGDPIRVRLVQGNVPQDLKFADDGMQRAAETHARLLQGPRVDVAVLPESVFPVPAGYLPDEVTRSMLEFVTANDSALIFGVFVEEPGYRFFNSALALSPDGAGGTAPVQRYSKHQLVPFGEFIPRGFRWFVDLMQIPIGDQQRGALRQPPLQLAGQRIAVNICYEDLFAPVIRAAFADPDAAPTLLLNLSNLAWFDDSIALDQHLQISRMRALETGRPMMRATNTGATAIIDARGNVVAVLPYLTAAALDAEVTGHVGSTPFIRYGHALPLALMGTALAVALALVRRRTPPASA
jgi:apolipoprotein N-acyltransferase